MTLYERLKERYEENPEEFPQHIWGETNDGMMTCLLHDWERIPGPHWKPKAQETLEVFLGLARTLSSLRWHTKKEGTFRAWAEALQISEENWEKPITEEVFQKIASLREKMNPDSRRGRVSY